MAGKTKTKMYDFAVMRELRKRDQLTIGDVSSRSGISPAVISKLERNQTSAELETLFRLSRVFGMTATDLLALAEKRTAQRTTASAHAGGEFSFKEIQYANIRLLYGEAPKGSKVSRPEIHHDDYEVCWILEGNICLSLPHEQHELKSGQAIQFDAILHHTYEALENSRVIIAHLRKDKRF